MPVCAWLELRITVEIHWSIWAAALKTMNLTANGKFRRVQSRSRSGLDWPRCATLNSWHVQRENRRDDTTMRGSARIFQRRRCRGGIIPDGLASVGLTVQVGQDRKTFQRFGWIGCFRLV